MTTSKQDFIQSLMALPKKPDYVGYAMNANDIYEALLSQLNQMIDGVDMRGATGWDLHDEDSQFMFYIYEYELEDALGEQKALDVIEKLPFDIDEYWEVTEHLAKLHFNVDTWVYIQGRHYDRDHVDVQIGVPRSK